MLPRDVGGGEDRPGGLAYGFINQAKTRFGSSMARDGNGGFRPFSLAARATAPAPRCERVFTHARAAVQYQQRRKRCEERASGAPQLHFRHSTKNVEQLVEIPLPKILMPPPSISRMLALGWRA